MKTTGTRWPCRCIEQGPPRTSPDADERCPQDLNGAMAHGFAQDLAPRGAPTSAHNRRDAQDLDLASVVEQLQGQGGADEALSAHHRESHAH
jgi:hypothetical protein